MLKNISPLISPSLLKILAEMGHGDEIVFSDAVQLLQTGVQIFQTPTSPAIPSTLRC